MTDTKAQIYYKDDDTIVWINIEPKNIYFGYNDQYKDEQWMLTAHDMDSDVIKDFALKNIVAWTGRDTLKVLNNIHNAKEKRSLENVFKPEKLVNEHMEQVYQELFETVGIMPVNYGFGFVQKGNPSTITFDEAMEHILNYTKVNACQYYQSL